MLSRTVQGRHYLLSRNRGSNRGLVQSFLMIHLTLESPSPWRRWYPLWYMATSDTLAIDATSIHISWLETWRGISASWVVTEPSANLKRSLKTEQSCYSFKPCCWRTQKAFPTCQNILISPKVSLGSYLGKLLRGGKMDIALRQEGLWLYGYISQANMMTGFHGDLSWNHPHSKITVFSNKNNLKSPKHP